MLTLIPDVYIKHLNESLTLTMLSPNKPLFMHTHTHTITKEMNWPYRLIQNGYLYLNSTFTLLYY